MLWPVFSTLQTSDFPDQKGWISRLLGPFNSAFSTLAVLMNGNVTFGDNIPCQTITKNFVYSSTTQFPLVVMWSLPSSQMQGTTPATPTELRICSALETINGTASPVALVPAWQYLPSSSTISIAYFAKLAYSAGTVTATSLVTGATYNIVMRAQP